MKIMRGLCPSVREHRYSENSEIGPGLEPSEIELKDTESTENVSQVISDIDDLISRCLKGEPVRFAMDWSQCGSVF